MTAKTKLVRATYIPERDILVAELKQAGDVMFERLATLASFEVRTPDGVKEAMSLWTLRSTQLENEKDNVEDEQGQCMLVLCVLEATRERPRRWKV